MFKDVECLGINMGTIQNLELLPVMDDGKICELESMLFQERSTFASKHKQNGR